MMSSEIEMRGAQAEDRFGENFVTNRGWEISKKQIGI